VGEGAAPLGVDAGEGAGPAGVVSGCADGATGGFASGVASGVAAGEMFADASGAGLGVGWDAGDEVLAGLEAGSCVGVAVGAGEGEVGGCAPEGAAGCCSHPRARKPARAAITAGKPFIPTNTDARVEKIFKDRCKSPDFRRFARCRVPLQRDRSV
jgi:hypothetical protein